MWFGLCNKCKGSKRHDEHTLCDKCEGSGALTESGKPIYTMPERDGND